MQPVRPNYFVLKGQDVKITYQTSSLSGQPLLSVQYEKKELHFGGEKIRLQETEIGQMVTVDLGFEPDRATKTLTLLIPLINLEGNQSSSFFHTEAIITDHLTSIGGPDLVKGAIQIYRFESLEGTAGIIIS